MNFPSNSNFLILKKCNSHTLLLYSCIIINFLLLHLSQTQSQQQPISLVSSLADHFQNMSKSEIESLVKALANITSTSTSAQHEKIIEDVIDDVLDEVMSLPEIDATPGSGSSTSLSPTLRSFDAPFLSLLDEDESLSAPGDMDPSYSSRNMEAYLKSHADEDLNAPNNKKRAIQSDGRQTKNHHLQKLPLEKLFPQIQTSPSPSQPSTTSTSHADNGNYDDGNVDSEDEGISKHVNLNPKQIQAKKTGRVNENKQTQKQLTSALLNHSMHSGYEPDEELDRLVFSQLPQGSKLVLKTVQIIKTDEDGNEEPIGDSAVTWDVLPVNRTSDAGEDLSENRQDEDNGSRVTKFTRKGGMKIPVYGMQISSTTEESDDGDGDEDQVTDSAAHNEDTASGAAVTEVDLMPDQMPAGSRHSTKHQAYKHGATEKEKEKKDKYFHGKDHSQEHIKTKTDKDGKKVTDYEGTEKELTDYINAHGKKVQDENERYKHSKKKNKGRKVTGFKRVYHKEEFQRTEHFYDDEEAKKIAESYGLTDQKEKSNHGVVQDTKKYHGTKIEHTDVDKLKNEHITNDGKHKGAHHSDEHSEKHKHGQKYSQQTQNQTPMKTHHHHHQQQHHQQQPLRHQQRPQNNHGHGHGHGQYPHPQQHPNHNYNNNHYQGQYSQPATLIDEFVQYATAPLISGFTASNGPPASPTTINSNIHKPKAYLTNPNHANQYHRQVAGAGSQPEPSIVPTPPSPATAAAEVTASVLLPKPSEMKVFFAERERKLPNEEQVNYYYAPNFGPNYTKDARGKELTSTFINKIGNASLDSMEISTTLPSSDSENTTGNTSMLDPAPAFYSTILKTTSPRKKTLRNQYARGKGLGNLLGVQKAKNVRASYTTVYPQQYAKTGSFIYGRGSRGQRYSTWIPFDNGDNSNEVQISNSTGSLSADSTSQESKGTAADSPEIQNSGNENESKAFPPVLIAKPKPYRISRRPGLQRHLAFRTPSAVPIVPARGQTHYFGAAIINHLPPAAPAATAVLHRIPSYPQLMNGFVNSVTGVFGRVG